MSTFSYRDSFEYNELKTAFDQEAEKGDGSSIQINQIQNIFNSLGVEDQKLLSEIQNRYNDDKDKKILFSDILKILQELGIRANSTEQKVFPVVFMNNGHLLFATKDSLKKIQDTDYSLQLIYDRINLGYSILPEKNTQIINDNIKLFQQNEFKPNEFTLTQDLWQWIYDCENDQNLSKGINFNELQSSLQDTQQNKKQYEYFSHKIYESSIRSKYLKDYGWNSKIENKKENRYLLNLERLSEEQNYLRCAMICVFHFDFQKSYQYLLKLSEQNNEGLKFLKSILVGLKNLQEYLEKDVQLQPFFQCCESDPEPSLFDNQYSRNKDMYFSADLMDKIDLNSANFNINDLLQIEVPQFKYLILKSHFNFVQKLCRDAKFNNPFIRTICEFISQKNYEDIIDDVNLPIMDRICYAFRFCSEDKLLKFINQELQINALNYCNLDYLIVLGSQNPVSYQMVQRYLNNTNDIQTVGLVSFHLKCLDFVQKDQFKNLYQEYRNLINKLQQYQYRFEMDNYIRQIEQRLKIQNQDSKLQDNNSTIHMCCSNCKTNLGYNHILKMAKREEFSNKINFCPNCHKKQPQCSICYQPIKILNPPLQNKAYNQKDLIKDINTNLDDGIVWCQYCRHGGHFNHLMEWFQDHTICPLADCKCECAQLL